MNALLTDLYQLTMAAGYWQAGKCEEIATFELFVRRLPANRNFLVAAGLEQAVEYLLNLRFEEEEISYLKSLPQFARVEEGFFDYLRRFRFTGDVFAAREGTPLFAGEPILIVRAPLVEAQIPETYLLATVGFQSLVATKAARLMEASGGRAVVEFGTRRAHSPQAGVIAARAAYIGGCAGTSNVLAGMRYGIPVFGTSAHAWVQSFASETEAFERLQALLGPAATYLIDTYNTLDGARRAVAIGKPFWGVRLDSGNLVELSRAVRSVLDSGGFPDAKIMATGDQLRRAQSRGGLQAGGDRCARTAPLHREIQRGEKHLARRQAGVPFRRSRPAGLRPRVRHGQRGPDPPCRPQRPARGPAGFRRRGARTRPRLHRQPAGQAQEPV